MGGGQRVAAKCLRRVYTGRAPPLIHDRARSRDIPRAIVERAAAKCTQVSPINLFMLARVR